MKSFLVPLYWTWCVGSVFILVRRRMNKKRSVVGSSSPEAAVSPIDPTASMSDAFSEPPPPSRPAPTSSAVTVAPPPPAAAAVSLGVPLSTVGSLAEALEGISLPCGLAPLTGSGDFDPRTLVLISDGHPAEVVGTSMADELERLGFSFTPLGEQALLARTERASVEVTVHPDSGVVDDMGTRRFPTAPRDTVVVELHLR